jgi:protoheme ferro-lyase
VTIPPRAKRIAEVAGHYHHFGGFSPYNALTASARRMRSRTNWRAAAAGCMSPAATATGRPGRVDALRSLRDAGATSVAILIMAPHQSSVSWDWYLKHAAEAAETLGASAARLVAVVQPWWKEAGYIAAIAAQVTASHHGVERAALPGRRADLHRARHPAAGRGDVALPRAIRRDGGGSGPRARSPRARHRLPEPAGRQPHRLVVADHRRGAAGRHMRAAGAKRWCRLPASSSITPKCSTISMSRRSTRPTRLGMGLTRARCVHDHPAFIAMLADRVEQSMAASTSASS